MEGEKNNINLPKGTINGYLFNKKGKKRCIILHGYGDNLQTLTGIAAQFVAADYEVNVFDLPFHGSSEWHSNVCTADDVCAIVVAHIEAQPAKPFALLGYSLGGRLVLAALPRLIAAKHTPTDLYLLAPAGAPQNWLHRYMEVPVWVKNVFNFSANYPRPWLATADLLHKIGWLPAFERAFAAKYFSDTKARTMMFGWWRSFSFLPVDTAKINTLCAEKGIKIHLFFGNDDNVLPKKSADFFEKSIKNKISQHFPTTHRGMAFIDIKTFIEA